MERWFYIAPLLVAALGLPACPPTPTPTPTPSPTATPPNPICSPGDTCGCWVQPPGEGWQKLPDCPAGCTLSGEPSVPADIQQNTLGDKVNQAIASLYPQCDIGGTCLLGDETQQQFQAKVEEKLRSMGLCAGQHTPSTDEVAVAEKADFPWQGFHIFVGDDSSGPVPPGGARRTVKWSPAAYTGSWLPPSVQPTPEPIGSCTDPIPPKVGKWGGPVSHNQWFDSTPKFYNKEAMTWDGQLVSGYCSALGIEELWCPARTECPGVKCEERQACERVGVSGLTNGKPLWRCSNGDVEVNPQNIFQARCGAGASWIEVCAADGSVCSRTPL